VTCIWRFKFRTCTSIEPNYAGNKHKSFKIIEIYMFAILGRAKPDTENIRGLNLEAVRHMAVQATKLQLLTGANFDSA
jgi:hypothetical protein